MMIVIPPRGKAEQTVIEQLEKRFGRLPEDYKAFLTTHDGAVPPSNHRVFIANDALSVRKFLPADEIEKEYDAIEGWNNNLIPIAFDSFGNYFSIGRFDGQVYFWDHELWEHNNLIFLAPTFSEFLYNMEKCNDDYIPKPVVISSWVDPNFKPEFD